MLKSSGPVDLSSPFVDATFPDGSRLQVVIPDITSLSSKPLRGWDTRHCTYRALATPAANGQAGEGALSSRFGSCSTPGWACRHRRRTGCRNRRRRRQRAPQRADSAESFSCRVHVPSWPWVHRAPHRSFLGARRECTVGGADAASRCGQPHRTEQEALREAADRSPNVQAPRSQAGGTQSGERPSAATIRSSTWVLVVGTLGRNGVRSSRVWASAGTASATVSASWRAS